MTRRAIAISGLTSDVAARLVAIATAETVHAEIRRARAPRRPPPPRRPSPEEIELAARDKDAFSLGAGAYAAIATAEPDVLAGPGLAVSIRRFRVTQSLFARWLGGPLDEGAVRWLEVGVAADYRIWASRSWRFWLGASAAAASLRLSGVGAVDGLPGEQDAWTVRAGGLLGVEARLAGPLWMGLTLEPGAILRPVPYEDARGASRAVEGAWLGAGLTLTLEPPPAPPAR